MPPRLRYNLMPLLYSRNCCWWELLVGQRSNEFTAAVAAPEPDSFLYNLKSSDSFLRLKSWVWDEMRARFSKYVMMVCKFRVSDDIATSAVLEPWVDKEVTLKKPVSVTLRSDESFYHDKIDQGYDQSHPFCYAHDVPPFRRHKQKWHFSRAFSGVYIWLQIRCAHGNKCLSIFPRRTTQKSVTLLIIGTLACEARDLLFQINQQLD